MTVDFDWKLLLTVGLLFICDMTSGEPPPLPPAAPAPGPVPEPLSRLSEEHLTEAEIPPGLPADLRREIEKTFDLTASSRAKAAESIGARRKAGAAAVPYLLRLMYDDAVVGTAYVQHDGIKDEVRKTVRDSAGKALIAIGEPAVEPCISALRHSSGNVRDEIIAILGSIRDLRAIEPLASLLSDPNYEVRRNVVFALIYWEDARVVPPLLRALKDEDPEVRRSTADGLANHRDARVVAALIESLTDNTNLVRQDAARSLGNQQSSEAVQPLLKLLHNASEDELVRSAAAHSLGQIPDTGGRQALLTVLNDRLMPDAVRRGAASGLEASRSAAFLPQLNFIAADERDKPEVRGEAVKAIAGLAGLKAIPLLNALAAQESTESHVRCCAAIYLVGLADGAIKDVNVVRALNGPYALGHNINALVRASEAKKSALRSLANHGATEAVRDAAKAMLNQRENKKGEKREQLP